MNDAEQAATRMADFCQEESLPNAALVCAVASGILAKRAASTLADARMLVDALGHYSGAFVVPLTQIH